jgi:hypothetical protein
MKATKRTRCCSNLPDALAKKSTREESFAERLQFFDADYANGSGNGFAPAFISSMSKVSNGIMSVGQFLLSSKFVCGGACFKWPASAH